MLLLNKYLYECQYRADAHNRALNDNRKKLKTINWTQNILGLIVATLSMSIYNRVDNCKSIPHNMVQTPVSCQPINKIIIVSSSILSLVATALGATSSIYKYDDKNTSHHIDYLNYTNLASDIILFINNNKSKNEILIFTELVHEKLDIYNNISSNIDISYLEKSKCIVPYPKNKFLSTSEPSKYSRKKRKLEESCQPCEKKEYE